MRAIILLTILLFSATHAFAASPRLLFDQGHRQAFLIENDGPLQLQDLATVFRQQGWQVESSSDKLTAERLSGVDALIISGAFAPLDRNEVAAVLAFLQQGGQLAVMLHIGAPLASLLQPLGVEIGNLAINESQNQPDGKTLNFTVTDLQQHPLTSGLERFTIYGGWPLRSQNPEDIVVASSSPHSWVDVNRDQRLSDGDVMSPFAVLISGKYGRGSFAVFADDAIFQNRFLQGGNRTLAENLGRWFKSKGNGQVEI